MASSVPINTVLANGVRPGVLTAVTLYTAPSSLAEGTRITAFTAANTDTSNRASYTVHIVPNAGSADNTNKIVPDNQLNPAGFCGDTQRVYEAEGHLIPPGGTLQVLVDTVDTIAFRATGIEF